MSLLINFNSKISAYSSIRYIDERRDMCSRYFGDEYKCYWIIKYGVSKYTKYHTLVFRNIPK